MDQAPWTSSRLAEVSNDVAILAKCQGLIGWLGVWLNEWLAGWMANWQRAEPRAGGRGEGRGEGLLTG